MKSTFDRGAFAHQQQFSGTRSDLLALSFSASAPILTWQLSRARQ